MADDQDKKQAAADEAAASAFTAKRPSVGAKAKARALGAASGGALPFEPDLPASPKPPDDPAFLSTKPAGGAAAAEDAAVAAAPIGAVEFERSRAPESKLRAKAARRVTERTGEPDPDDDRPRRQAPRRRRKWPLIAIGIIVGLVVAVCAAFAIWRWLWSNDAQDIQGVWVVSGSDQAVQITGDGVALSTDVTYGYTLDQESKNIYLSFGKMSGSSHYRFSLDRDTLSLRDGEASWGESLIDDFTWTARALVALVQGEEASPELAGEGTTLLSRSASGEANLYQTPAATVVTITSSSDDEEDDDGADDDFGYDGDSGYDDDSGYDGSYDPSSEDDEL